MRCSEAREKLFDYMDGLLSGSQLEAMEQHLESCVDCRSELESMRLLEGRLREEVPALWKGMEPSPGFAMRLKTMDLTPQKPSVWSYLDSVLAGFLNHRPAMAAGLTVLIAIVLALTLPGIIDEGDDEIGEVAGAPSGTVSERSLAVTNVPAGEQGEEVMMQMATPSATTLPDSQYDFKFSWDTDEHSVPQGTATPAPAATEPSALPPPPVTGPAPQPSPSFSTEGIGAADCAALDGLMFGGQSDYQDKEVRLALSNQGVQATLQGGTVCSAQVFSEFHLEGYVCSGSTVFILFELNDSAINGLFVCIEAGSVTRTSLIP